MINLVTQKTLDFLVTKEVLSSSNSDEMDFYRYGIEITISSVLNILLIVLIGTISNQIIESVIFLTCFILLRSFTGGFHAKTYFNCNAMFCISFICVLLLYNLTWSHLNYVLGLLLALPCIALIAVFCPIENGNKPIPQEKIKGHKRTGILLSIVIGLIAEVLIQGHNPYGSLILYTLLLVVVLIIAAKIKGREMS